MRAKNGFTQRRKEQKSGGAKKTVDRIFAPLVFLFFAPLREMLLASAYNLILCESSAQSNF
jgi:hypothetical protein